MSCKLMIFDLTLTAGLFRSMYYSILKKIDVIFIYYSEDEFINSIKNEITHI